jgi:plastocyanin
MKNIFKIVVLGLLLMSKFSFAQEDVKDKEMKAKKIELVQTKGKFDIESLKLKEGDYIFAIKNEKVGKDVGFYLRKEGEKSSVRNSDKAGYIKNNQTGMTGVVHLEKGTYVYSCPLNPTKDCMITVE